MKIVNNKKPIQKVLKTLAIVAFISVLSSMALVQSGCKQADHNITGNWLINFNLDGSGSFLVAFSGTNTIGSVIWENQMSGEYNVAGTQVDFVLRVYVNITNSTATELFVYSFSGDFENKDHMSGTCTASRYSTPNEYISGTWTADRR